MNSQSQKGLILEAAIAWRQGLATLDQLAAAVDGYLALPSQRLRITKHAIERFRTRAGSKQNEAEAKVKLQAMLDRAKEVEVKPQWRVMALLNHGFEEARYFLDGMWVLVVSNDAVVTCYRKEGDKWR